MKRAVDNKMVTRHYEQCQKNTKREMLLDSIAWTIRQFPAEKQREILKRYTAN